MEENVINLKENKQIEQKKIDGKRLSLFVTRTAVLLALILAFQSIGLLIPEQMTKQIIVGSLVNFTLFIAVMGVGLIGASFIGLVSPFLAMAFGIAPLNILLVPFVAIGNFILVLAFYLIERFVVKKFFKEKRGFMFISIGTAAVLKGLYLWFAFLNIAKLLLPAVPPALLLVFSYPQLITAAIGGIIAFFAIPALKKSKVL